VPGWWTGDAAAYADLTRRLAARVYDAVRKEPDHPTTVWPPEWPPTMFELFEFSF
jgi:hypothetical protein